MQAGLAHRLDGQSDLVLGGHLCHAFTLAP
jgi:hypothetical protein